MSAYRKATILFTLSILGGCTATPYQPMGFAGGYNDAHIKDNVYYVEVATNGFTSQTTAVQYFHRRAKELCMENGFKDYKIKGERDTSVSMATGSYGGGAVNVSSVNKPGFSGYVECLK